jgi:hypothetical protein
MPAKDATRTARRVSADSGRCYAQVASQHSPRKLCLFLVEKDGSAADKLGGVMARDAPEVTARIHSGDARELVGRLLGAPRDLPLSGLLDPYGQSLDPDQRLA